MHHIIVFSKSAAPMVMRGLMSKSGINQQSCNAGSAEHSICRRKHADCAEVNELLVIKALVSHKCLACIETGKNGDAN